MSPQDLSDQDLIAEVVCRCQLGNAFRRDLEESLRREAADAGHSDLHEIWLGE